jgi:hypothetical protein
MVKNIRNLITTKEIEPKLLTKEEMTNEFDIIKSIIIAFFEINLYILRKLEQEYSTFIQLLREKPEKSYILVKFTNINKSYGKIFTAITTSVKPQLEIYTNKLELVLKKQVLLFIGLVAKREKENKETEGNTAKVKRFFFGNIDKIAETFNNFIRERRKFSLAYYDKVSEIIEGLKQPEIIKINIEKYIEISQKIRQEIIDFIKYYDKQNKGLKVILTKVSSLIRTNWEF